MEGWKEGKGGRERNLYRSWNLRRDKEYGWNEGKKNNSRYKKG